MEGVDICIRFCFNFLNFTAAARVIAGFRQCINGREEQQLDTMSLMCSRIALWRRFCSTRFAAVTGNENVARISSQADGAP